MGSPSLTETLLCGAYLYYSHGSQRSESLHCMGHSPIVTKFLTVMQVHSINNSGDYQSAALAEVITLSFTEVLLSPQANANILPDF
jgi:hypothetical protein